MDIMDPAMEIRKLKPSQVQELTMILETHELWKGLMSIIPKYLKRFNYTCDISISNPHKYNSLHFRIIENASVRTDKSCTEILLEEWGTSGRVLPTVGHLLYLLTKARLFRAADYVAALLNQPKPNRPEQGPEASVTIDLINASEVNDNINRGDIEKILDEINYPASAVKIISSLNLQKTSKVSKPVIPKIIITSNCEEKTNTVPDCSVPVVKYKYVKDSDISETDMIKFSSRSVDNQEVSTKNPEHSTAYCEIDSDEVKYLPAGLNGSNSVIDSTQIELPNISEILQSEQNSNLPDISLLNNSNVRTQNSQEDMSSNTCYNPALSELLSNKSLPIDQIQSQSHENALSNANIPDLSAFQLSYAETRNDEIISDISYHPHVSAIQTNNQMVSSANILISESSVSNNFNLPDFNALKSDSSNLYLETSGNDIQDSNSSSSDLIPHISVLTMDKSQICLEEKPSNKLNSSCESLMTPDLETRNKITSTNSSSDSNSRPCNSPLPQLSLNTKLPHFSYKDLMVATNNFNDNLYTDEIASGRFLGSGAFGSVFLAFGLLEIPVAVKKLVLENVDYVDVEATVTKQFKNEVEVLSRYKHPNLLSLVGYSCDGCTYCLLYEYIQGGALSVRLQAKSNKLQWKDRLKIALGTASAVAYLHTAFPTPLIHRDIKSANILLDCSNTPKLCDFGLIKLSPTQNTATATTVFGTSAYMAPEAFRGDISVKMDTFSFGVVLLELLTSLPPLDENREGTDLVTHILENCDEDSISSLVDNETGLWMEDEVNYDKELYKISMMCLEEKKKRPNMVTIRDLIYELTKKLF